jgi:hypothetical protein
VIRRPRCGWCRARLHGRLTAELDGVPYCLADGPRRSCFARAFDARLDQKIADSLGEGT